MNLLCFQGSHFLFSGNAIFLNDVNSIVSDDGKSSIWSNGNVPYVFKTQPGSLESNIKLAESVFSRLVLDENPWEHCI